MYPRQGHRVDEAVPGEVRPRTVERFHHEASHDVALQGDEARLALRRVHGEGALVVGDDGDGVVARERDDLGHEHPVSGFPQLGCEGVAADEGDVDEDRIESEEARPPDERGDRPVGADDHHRLGPAVAEVEHRRLHRRGIAGVGTDPRELELAPLERAGEALVAREPVRVVLVEDPDPGHAEVARQPLDHLLGFLEIGGAHVDHHGPAPAAQEFRPGERTDVGHAGGGGDRLGRVGGRRADRPDEGEDPVLLDEPAGIGDRELRLVGVVEGDELESSPVHPPRLVAFLERGADPEPHAAAERFRRPGERGGLAEQHPVPGYARNVIGGPGRNQGDRGDEGQNRAGETHSGRAR